MSWQEQQANSKNGNECRPVFEMRPPDDLRMLGMRVRGLPGALRHRLAEVVYKSTVRLAGY